MAAVTQGIAAMIRACHPPDGDLWLTQYAHRLQRKAKPLRPKLPRTATIDELLWLAERLMNEGRYLLEEERRAGALLFRDGLIIATWMIHPIRRKNMAELQLGKTFIFEDRVIRVQISAEDTKNGVELHRDYPDWLVEPWMEYLEFVRPILRAEASDPDEGWVWLGRGGERLRAASLRVITTHRTKQYLGRSVPPQNFRHSTVTDIARLRPDLIHIAKDVLGHKTGVTSERYYILADRFRAFSDHDAMIERRRGKIE